MPQISKLRIANFLYNDGKRLIADELFEFTSKQGKQVQNAMINLKNGGGKSVLVQLMLQPIIPKARIAGRRMESFFTRATDHCFIALEWQKDNSKEKLLTGIAMASGEITGGSDEESIGRPVKYYTFLTSYSDNGTKYDILQLPFSRKEKNRFQAASFNEIRDLAKKSGGELLVFSSDDSRQWRETLSEYGVIQEEWESIDEKVNAEEGGMTKFFEKYKQSDSLVDKLLIPAIEGRFGQTTQKDEDASLSTMLLNHAKIYHKQEDLIKEKEACAAFQKTLEQLDERVQSVWKKNDDYEKSIKEFSAFFNALSEQRKILDEKIILLRETLIGLDNELTEIDYEACSEEYYKAKEQFDEIELKYTELKHELTKKKEELSETEGTIQVLECARISKELSEIKSKMKAVNEQIEEKKGNSDIARRMASLGYTVKRKVEKLFCEKQESLFQRNKEKNELLKAKEEEEARLKKAERKHHETENEYAKAEQVLTTAKEETDKLVKKLSLETTRWLDDCYHSEEFQREKEINDETEKRQKDEIEKLQKQSSELTVKQKKIEEMELELYKKSASNEIEIKDVNRRFKEYLNYEIKGTEICSLLSLQSETMFNGELLRYLLERERELTSKKESFSTRLSMVNEEIRATEQGYIHVPKRVIDFLTDQGIVFQTCEKYLSTSLRDTLTTEKCLTVLDSCPSVAYGIILDSKEREKLRGIHRELEEWLPAMVPVFSYEQISEIIEGKELKGDDVAFYSVAYFSSRENFLIGLREKEQELETRKKLNDSLLSEVHNQQRVAEDLSSFSYSTRGEYEQLLEKLKRIQDEISDNLQRLSKEKEENEEKLQESQKSQKKVEQELEQLKQWFSVYDDFLERWNAEIPAYDELQKASQNKKDAKATYEGCRKKVEDLASQLEERKQEIDKLSGEIAELETPRNELSEVTSTEVLEGDWTTLFQEYEELKRTQDKDLQVLYERKTHYQSEFTKCSNQLQAFTLPEEMYRDVIFNLADFELAKESGKKLRIEKERLQEEESESNKELGKWEVRFQSTKEKLKKYDNHPLLKEKIKGNYSSRRNKLNTQQKEVQEEKRITETLQTKVGHCADRTKDFLSNHKSIQTDSIGELMENLEQQFERMKRILQENQRAFTMEKEELLNLLNQESSKNSLYRIDEIAALQRFHQMVRSEDMKGDKYFTLSEQVVCVNKTTALRISQIETDLKEFEKGRSDLLRQCLLQGQQIYEGLKRLSKSSLVSLFEGKPKKQMIKINIPDEVDANVAEAALEGELGFGVQDIVSLMSKDVAESELLAKANKIVSSSSLLRRYVGKNQIPVEVFKIDLNPENAKYRTWEDTQIRSSGAEKLVAYFSVILSLLNYSRSDYGDLNDKSLTSVLILDNPFGAISSGHLLKPVFEIAKHFRVQMICLSDLNKSDITACFENFIKAVVKPLKYSSLEMLTHEGNEEIEHGFYKSEQLNLFRETIISM